MFLNYTVADKLVYNVKALIITKQSIKNDKALIMPRHINYIVFIFLKCKRLDKMEMTGRQSDSRQK